jgi:predicted nucleotidyltransferase component of viral defense system
MKSYPETHIRRAEIAQLIILNQIYNQRGSQNLIFQGGTALRWCHGGSRFSEDLDFVTPLAIEEVQAFVKVALKGIKRVMIPHFGVGEIELIEKSSRADAFKCFLTLRPEAAREKISVKLEVEGLAAHQQPDTHNHVLSTLPTVAYLIGAGDFRVPRPNAVIVAETPEEILSDKVRALLERRYLKGRDLFDLWYLRTVLKTDAQIEVVRRKFQMYRAPFTARRSMDFFIAPSREEKKAMQTAIEQDLSRFLAPEILAVQRAQRFDALIGTAGSLFAELRAKGVQLP